MIRHYKVKEGYSMNIDQVAFGQVAITLAKHFDSMYYVDIETDSFIEFFHSQMLNELNLPAQGTDFFEFLREQARRVVHPDDLDYVLQLIDKKSIIRKITKNNSSLIVCRFVLGGKIIHICHISIMCEDNKHILGCIKNIEKEFRTQEEQELILRSAERLARLDELTGTRNKNAYTEHVREIDEMIQSGEEVAPFAVVMCDINDLKLINDSRGHSFGDEAIQRVGRLLSNIFENSSVYRVGGDEFIAILSDDDYEKREDLLNLLRIESRTNGRWRSGPVVASGMSAYSPELDSCFNDVFERADAEMYENKKDLKNEAAEVPDKQEPIEQEIPDERKRNLDSLFGAILTTAGDGYVFLTDLKYSYSRWALPLVNDFGLPAEYMYNVEKIWEKNIHPDDLNRYLEVVEAVLKGNSVLYSISYRARKADGTYVFLKPRGFVMCDCNGEPEYFGGIIIPQ